MSDALTIEFPQEEVDKLIQAMTYASDKLSLDMGQAMKQAVNRLVASFGASTKIAPKYRTVTLLPQERSPRKDLKAFGIEGYSGKPKRKQLKIVYARNKTNAKKKHALIRSRGLAKMTWRMAAKSVVGRVSGMTFKSINAAVLAKTANIHIDTRADFKGRLGGEVYAEIHNSLPYIIPAMKGGKQSIDTAFQRAASGLIKSADKQLERRLGK